MKTRTSPLDAAPAGSRRHEDLKRALQDYRRDIDLRVRATLAGARDAQADSRAARLREDGEIDDVPATEDIEFGIVQLKSETIARIDEALARLEAGAYGDCTDCGDEIPKARLRAIPFAVRCVECQEATESTFRQERAFRGAATRRLFRTRDSDLSGAV